MESKQSIFFTLIYIVMASALWSGCAKSDDAKPNYDSVTIGTQVWMTENLQVTKYRNGDPILNIQDNSIWISPPEGGYCDYNNNATIGETYGKLYNWYAVNDPRGLAPEGWRIPTKEDWEILINFLGGENLAGDKLKETGVVHWDSPNNTATNESGFTALPEGYRNSSSGNFEQIGYIATFWTFTQASESDAWKIHFTANSGSNVYIQDYSKKWGYAVRCIK